MLIPLATANIFFITWITVLGLRVLLVLWQKLSYFVYIGVNLVIVIIILLADLFVLVQ